MPLNIFKITKNDIPVPPYFTILYHTLSQFVLIFCHTLPQKTMDIVVVISGNHMAIAIENIEHGHRNRELSHRKHGDVP